MARRMDADAPHPHCPFCGLPMHFARPAPDVSAHRVLQAFDCRWCGVVLNVAPGVETLQLAAPPLAPG
jgi:hypothetical protein